MMIIASAVAAALLGAQDTDPAEIDIEAADAWSARFDAIVEAGALTPHNPSPDNPWGEMNPAAPAETAQFAFMVGRFDCTFPTVGMNPHDPERVETNRMTWQAFYALNGMAIRDEFYGSASYGEQTRVWDDVAGEWMITFQTSPALVNIRPGPPRPVRGEFSATQIGDAMVMVRNRTDAQDRAYINHVTFHTITEDGFLWKSERLYGESDPYLEMEITCVRVDGPGFLMAE